MVDGTGRDGSADLQTRRAGTTGAGRSGVGTAVRLLCIATAILTAATGTATAQPELKSLPWADQPPPAAAPPTGPPQQPPAFPSAAPIAPGAQPGSWKVLLIAADHAQPVFSNAVDTLRQRLMSFGIPGQDIGVLKADAQTPAVVANKANFDVQMARLAGPAGSGCFVFITSHGMRNGGLVVTRANGVLPPSYLAQSLERACGERPTVVITSGCFSGIYAGDPGMRRPNRIILTAARADLPSFGCSADEHYTFYDQCLLQSLRRGEPWRSIAVRVNACVERREQHEHTPASYPQTFFGERVAPLLAF